MIWQAFHHAIYDLIMASEKVSVHGHSASSKQGGLERPVSFPKKRCFAVGNINK